MEKPVTSVKYLERLIMMISKYLERLIMISKYFERLIMISKIW